MYIINLMQLVPQDVDIIYCSDHGFNFRSRGDLRENHIFSPRGMLATNFQTLGFDHVSQDSIGRLIYRRAGGNPDRTVFFKGETGDLVKYQMYGVDLV